MAAPGNEYAFDLNVALAAAERWSKRGVQHSKFEQAVKNKQYTELDTRQRCAARVNRLVTRLQESAPQLAEAVGAESTESVGRQLARAAVTPQAVSDVLVERVIGQTRDFQYIEFLEQGIFVCKSIGRIVTQLGGGRFSYATGFMVSPRLLITNHHVLQSAADAASSKIEFDYQRDRLGQALTPRSFSLDPDTFFLNDLDLDFALVAIKPNNAGRPLGDYGWCPLIKDAGKIIGGEPINIIQHPKGEMKQIVIRENRLSDPFEGKDLFYQYEADTEPGSSGSPVFNDQWEVVALHHSGVPKRNKNGELLDTDGKVWKKGDDPSRLDWVANEGVRISKLVEFIAKAPIKPAMKPLLAEFLEAKPPSIPTVIIPDEPEQTIVKPHPVPPRLGENKPMIDPATTAANGNSITFTIPLQVTISIGTPGIAGHQIAVNGGGTASFVGVAPESITPDPSDLDYQHRPGYDPDFLGFDVPFPTLTSATRKKAYAIPGLTGNERFLLKYHHYSLIFNQDRKLAFVSGVNYDPTAAVQFSRQGSDRWFYDPRVQPEKELQAGNDLYAGNPLDRGHLVRRADSAWGQTEAEAKLANDDTFHFTNCSPQHEITNQGIAKKAPPGLLLWGKLEEHIAKQGRQESRKLSIFNGPVFRSNDRKYRDVQLPKEFWKMVVFENDSGEPGAAAFVLTQAELIQDLKEEFDVGEYKAVQVRLKDLETKTGLDFGKASGWDVLEQEGAEESFTGDIPAIVLESLSDIKL